MKKMVGGGEAATPHFLDIEYGPSVACTVGRTWLTYSLCMAHIWPMYDLYMAYIWPYIWPYYPYFLDLCRASYPVGVFEHAHL